MKILIGYQYFSFKGGIEHVIAEQARGYRAAGHDVALVTSSYLEDRPERIEPDIPIHRIGALNTAYHRLGVPFAVPIPTPANLRRLTALVRGADVVNVHGHPYLFSSVLIALARRYHKPVLLTQHNTKIAATNPLVSVVYGAFDRTLGGLSLRTADVVVAVSDETRAYVREVARRPIDARTVYNGIDAHTYRPSPDKAALRAELGLSPEEFICLTIRRITFKNGIDTLLEAASRPGLEGVRFLIGGTGPDLAAAREQVASRGLDNVTLLGFVTDEDLPRYYQAADAFVLPSRPGEGFPMVVLEAFASGIPVIATRSGGHVEVIEPGRNGVLVSPEAPEELADAIRALRATPLDGVEQRCRALVEEGFTWETNVDAMLDIAQELVSSGH